MLAGEPVSAALTDSFSNLVRPDPYVCASLRFTDAGVEERLNWDPAECSQIESDLSSMIEWVSE